MIWNHHLKLLCVVVVAALIFYAAANMQAQVTGGTISGTVTDSSAKVVTNARISIVNIETGVSREVTTNDEGFYSAPNLQAGPYKVTFAAQGFKTETKAGITLTVAASITLDQTVHVGSITETVSVQSEIPAVQTSSSDISAMVNATTVRELPLNGRSWTDLAQLQPGVSAIHTQPDFSAGTDRGNRGFGQQLTISGARPQQNNYRLDGVSLNDYANGAPGSVLGGNLGVDAIQEFSVITSNYSAEYGKTSGGVVNAITRAGTNKLHGSAYEFLRNSKLDAKNFFDLPACQGPPVPGVCGPIPPFKRNQFGGTIGGTIQKDKTFFFADFEGIRQSLGLTTIATVPSEVARTGKLFGIYSPGPPPSCSAGVVTSDGACQVTVNAAAAQYFTFYPHAPASAQIAGSDTAQYSFAGQQIVNENFLTARIDHNFSDKDSLFGTYMFDRTPYSSPDGLNNVEFDTLTARQFVSIEETHIFSPSFANSIRIGGNHEAVNNNQSAKAINPDASRTDLGVGGTSFAGRAASQVLMGGGVSDFSGGVGGSPTYFYHWNSLQAYDDAFFTKGTHSIRFGGAFERMMLNVIADTDPNGIWRFTDFAGFLTNNPTKFQGGIASTLSPRNLRQNIFGLYIQDDWRWKPNLTLNLGLRYETSTVPLETAGKTANLKSLSDALPICGKVTPAVQSGCAGAGSFFANPTFKNFEPRIGFAWDVFRNGKTAVRGGIGLFDVLPLPYQFVLMTTQSAPFFSYTAINSPGQGTFFSGLTSFPANTLRSTYVDSHSKRNYVMQWNLNVQQQLTPTLAAMVAYVGSRGVHQPFKVDEADLVIPTKTPYGYLWPQVDISGNLTSGPNAGNAPVPINQNFGSVRGIFYEGHSYYNALEAQLAKRMSHGFQVQGTYTWSKSMDTSSASVAGDTFGNSISSLHWFDMKLSRGLSDFNVGQTLVVNGTWELPTPRNSSALAAWALGGWQPGLIFTASGGVPFSATWGTGSDPQYTLSSDDWAFPNRLGGSGCNTLTRPGNPNNYIKTDCFVVPTISDPTVWAANCDQFPPNAQPSSGPAFAAPFPQCFNLRGNAGRNILIGPGVTSLDFSLFKNNYIKRISEQFNIQFRAEIFNILNHPNFAPPSTPTNTDIYDGTGTLNPTAGQLTRTTTSAREAQFAIKVIF
ncbi:MAG TPA: TonB-dependent receptor [Candidatus Sulfotelmatobacter sp.]|nr:TonB-dependent receptor [Candidatus Sulfotelmatobacter sp.]